MVSNRAIVEYKRLIGFELNLIILAVFAECSIAIVRHILLSKILTISDIIVITYVTFLL
jgi:hypothetical protein